MPAGALTSYFDVAQVTLYAFWIFFAGLILYLRREDKREGYPLDNDRAGRVRVEGFPPMPRKKVFRLDSGETRTAPRDEAPMTLRAVQGDAWTGAPIRPQGWGMLDAVGPASYAERPMTPESDDGYGGNKIVPIRVAPEFFIAPEDPDPRGWTAVGADERVGGTVVECWVDRTEVLIRFLEVETPAPLGGAGGPRRVLVPMPLSRLDVKGRRVVVKSVLGRQFADAPSLSNPDQITMREEDQFSAFFGGGNLYADPRRLEPLI